MMDQSSSFPATALRQQFGDKLPSITRKITACVACRKQKIKCHMGHDGTCSRCKKRGLACTVNKSLQMILESDVGWKEAIENRIQQLEAGLGTVARQLNLPSLVETDVDSVTGDPPTAIPGVSSTHISSTTEHDSPHNYELVMDPDSGPAAIPGSVVSPVSMLGLNTTTRPEQDLISRGVITIERARIFLDVYQDRLDHFLYRIMGDRRTLEDVRSASPLLLSAICTVGALHLGASPDFEKCYQEFLAVAAAHTFPRKDTIDDVRGLCVAAFWLSAISWSCTGAAVRMATEIGLHRSIFKALQGDRIHYTRTRLYYLVYVCDHHFSIAYGRPPMTRQDDAIRACMQFLATEHAGEDDARLVSQVQFWLVGSEIYETFGIDVERPLDLSMIEPLRRFSIRLDAIRADWTERFSQNKFVGNYPRKGVGLHFHFAKLYLYSMAFRGISRPNFRAPEVALDIDELANSAVLSATAILRAIVSDEEIQSYLNGLPSYFHMMIAFAVVFVLKVSTKYASSVRVDTSEIRSLVADLVRVLQRLSMNMHPRHLLVSVAHGAEKLLKACSATLQRPVPSNAHVTMSPSVLDNGFYDLSHGWNAVLFDNFSMGDFDFLPIQEDLGMSNSAFSYQP